MTLPKTLRFTAALAAAGALVTSADAKLDFVKDVKPVLQQNCVSCHNEKHAEENGNYRMDNRADAFKPKKGKERISPGHPDESLVYTLLKRPLDDDKHMPPKERPQPTTKEIDTIRTWIAEGADWPEGSTLTATLSFVLGVEPILEEGGPVSATSLNTLKTWFNEGAYWPDGVKLPGTKPMSKAPAGATIDFAHNVLPILSNGGPLSADDIAILRRWVDEGALWPENIHIGGGKKGGKEMTLVEEIRKKVMEVSTEKTASDMKPYTNTIPGTNVNYAMVPIPGGEFMMGSPDSEAGRKPATKARSTK